MGKPPRDFPDLQFPFCSTQTVIVGGSHEAGVCNQSGVIMSVCVINRHVSNPDTTPLVKAYATGLGGPYLTLHIML